MCSLFRPRHLCLAASTFLLAALHGPTAAAGTQDVPDPGVLTAVAAQPASVKGEFVLISVGDLINARPVPERPDPALAGLIDIVRAGDTAIGNQEGIFFDLDTFRGRKVTRRTTTIRDITFAYDTVLGAIEVFDGKNKSSAVFV